MYEMLTGKRAWGGMNPSQISYAVLYNNQTLQLDDDPDIVGTLALQCMSHVPSQRPSAAAIVDTLRHHLAERTSR